jgi:hypothetical protein
VTVALFWSASTRGFYAPQIHGDAIPADAVPVTHEHHAALMEAQAAGLEIVSDYGVPIARARVLAAPTLADYRRALAQHVDAVARARGYDGGADCASYALSGNPVWAAEAAAFLAWRDGFRAAADAALPAAPSIADLLASMPLMEWPA